jgi:hypothetical protein
MILTIILTIALDTMPIQPIRVLLPRPVKSQTVKPKRDDKNKGTKTDDANSRILGSRPADLVSR